MLSENGETERLEPLLRRHGSDKGNEVRGGAAGWQASCEGVSRSCATSRMFDVGFGSFGSVVWRRSWCPWAGIGVPAFWQSLRRLFRLVASAHNLLQLKGMAERKGFKPRYRSGQSTSGFPRAERERREVSAVSPRPPADFSRLLLTIA
jgi:hypothetical protein